MPPGGEERSGEVHPDSEDDGAEGSGNAFEDIEGKSGGHAGVLEADFDGEGAAVPDRKAGDPAAGVAEQVADGVV